MSTVTTSAPTEVLDRTGSGMRTAVTAAALVGALGSAGYIAGLFLLAGASNAEAQRAPITIVECLLAGLAYVIVAVTLPGLAGVTRPPRWALSLAAAGAAFVGVQGWVYGTMVANLANVLPEDVFEDAGKETFLLNLTLLPSMVLCLAGYVSLAIVGWRRKATSRGASILLILAGLAALLGPFPPVGLLGGLALAWVARSAKPITG
ncbi:hypothetical protein [Dactylosporangium darangshiense]|uniref:hypothetical protein n=1 Tax=Dactylosporangium darangshiense TaxID=579108 RepID=UPI003629056F